MKKLHGFAAVNSRRVDRAVKRARARTKARRKVADSIARRYYARLRLKGKISVMPKELGRPYEDLRSGFKAMQESFELAKREGLKSIPRSFERGRAPDRWIVPPQSYVEEEGMKAKKTYGLTEDQLLAFSRLGWTWERPSEVSAKKRVLDSLVALGLAETVTGSRYYRAARRYCR